MESTFQINLNTYKMTFKPNFCLLILCILSLLSCEKEVKMDLASGPAKLVVEGNIETDRFPFVVLTKSVGYFSKIDLELIQNSFVHDAKVTISDGTQTIQLKEYTIDTGKNSSIKFYIYTVDTSSITALNFRGKKETTYDLKIEFEGNTYTASTKIPNVDPLDSVWFRKPKGRAPIAASMMMYVRYSDPDTLGNYARYFTKTQYSPFYPGFNSVFEDAIINGQTLDSLNLVAGYDRSRDIEIDSLGFYFMTDTVTLKWCAIDKDVYQFFRTYEYAIRTVGNPFATPVNIKTNIKGGALGYWAGYGSYYKTIVVPVE